MGPELGLGASWGSLDEEDETVPESRRPGLFERALGFLLRHLGTRE